MSHQPEEATTNPPATPTPGIWKARGVAAPLYEMRISATGHPLFCCHPEDGGRAFVPQSLDAYELVEPGATWASLARSLLPPRSDEETLLRLTEAALRGLATNAYSNVGDGEELGITAARAARAALIALEVPPVLAPEETTR